MQINYLRHAIFKYYYLAEQYEFYLPTNGVLECSNYTTTIFGLSSEDKVDFLCSFWKTLLTFAMLENASQEVWYNM